jgi:hypothetical protein
VIESLFVHSDRPDDMSASEYERTIIRSRKRWPSDRASAGGPLFAQCTASAVR